MSYLDFKEKEQEDDELNFCARSQLNKSQLFRDVENPWLARANLAFESVPKEEEKLNKFKSIFSRKVPV